jgi:hypothetical protein
MITTILFVLLLATAFGFRLGTRLNVREAIVSDTYWHLYCAELIRENNFRIPASLPSVILKHEYNYPFGYHFFLALFPKQIRIWIERGTGALFDTLITIIIYTGSQWLCSLNHISHGNWLSLFVAGLYAFAPALLRIGSGPRAYNGSERIPGQMLYLLHILLAYHGFVTGQPVSIILSAIFGGLLVLTSKFAMQVLVFFGISLAMVIDVHYALLIAASLFASFIISGGKSYRIIVGSVKHSYHYFRRLQRIFLYPHVITFAAYKRNVSAAIKQLFAGKTEPFKSWFYHERYFLHLLFTVFPYFFLVPVLALDISELSRTDLFLYTWSSSALAWFFLTKLKPILFLGEGERYLEYAMFPTLFLCVTHLHTYWLLIPAFLAAYSIYSMPYFAKDYIASMKNLHDDHDRSGKLFAELASLPVGNVMPIGWVHYQTLARNPFPVLTFGSGLDEKILSVDEYFYVYGNYPYPGSDFEGILEKYDISYVVADKSCLSTYYSLHMKNPEKLNTLILPLAESQMLYLFVTKRSIIARYEKINKFIENGQIREAKNEIEELLRLQPNSSELYLTLGNLYMQLESVEEAAAAFATSSSLKSTPAAAINHAQALLLLSRINEAEQVISAALAVEPSNEALREILTKIKQLRPGSED